ncbi:uncharacterized protein ACN2A1_006862 isoform 1-T1 [Glossina fuscipes fuscipes]
MDLYEMNRRILLPFQFRLPKGSPYRCEHEGDHIKICTHAHRGGIDMDPSSNISIGSESLLVSIWAGLPVFNLPLKFLRYSDEIRCADMFWSKVLLVNVEMTLTISIKFYGINFPKAIDQICTTNEREEWQMQ